MNLTCNRMALSSAFSAVGRAVSPRSTLPVLGSVLFQALGDTLRLAATDLEIAIERTLAAEIAEGGEFTVPYRAASDLLGKLEAETVTLATAEQNTVLLKAGRSTYRLLTLSPEEFPSLPEVAPDKSFRLLASDLHALIRFVLPATGDDDTRPVLAGVYWEQTAEHLRLVATDTHRLNYREIAAPEGMPEGKCLVPKSTMEEILKSLGRESNAPVTVTVDENQIQVAAEGVRVTARLVAATYPLYQRVIPPSYTRTLTLAREELLRAVRRLSVIAKEGGQRLTLTCEAERLLLHTQSRELGEGSEEVPAVLSAEPITLVLDWRYLQDALAVLEGEAVCLQMNEALSPVGIQSVGVGASELALVMPMQLE